MKPALRFLAALVVCALLVAGCASKPSPPSPALYRFEVVDCESGCRDTVLARTLYPHEAGGRVAVLWNDSTRVASYPADKVRIRRLP